MTKKIEEYQDKCGKPKMGKKPREGIKNTVVTSNLRLESSQPNLRSTSRIHVHYTQCFDCHYLESTNFPFASRNSPMDFSQTSCC